MPRNKYPEETRNKIVDAAAKLFLTKGYAETTILDIVGNMDGMTRGAFYHHFKSKKEVFDAITMRLAKFSESWQADLTGMNGLQKLRTILFLQKEFLKSPYKEMLVLIWSLTRNPEFLVEQFNMGKYSAEFIATIISEGITDGTIRKDVNPRLTAEFVTILMNFWISPVYFPGSDEEIREKLVFLRTVGNNMGCEIFDEETFCEFYETAKILNREVKLALQSANKEVKNG